MITVDEARRLLPELTAIAISGHGRVIDALEQVGLAGSGCCYSRSSRTVPHCSDNPDHSRAAAWYLRLLATGTHTTQSDVAAAALQDCRQIMDISQCDATPSPQTSTTTKNASNPSLTRP